MRATTEPLEDNRVRLTVEIDQEEIDKALDGVVRTLARQARIPGFRPGKVPRRVLEARMGGAEALRAEALREALPDFYARAVVETEVEPIGAPEIDVTAGEQSGPVAFDARVQVRPQVAVPGYGGIEVTVPRLAVHDQEVDAQVDRLREFDGELVDAARPVQEGDYVTLDIAAHDDQGNQVVESADMVYPLGQRSLGPEIDEALLGMAAGEHKEVRATIPGPDEPRPATFSLRVKGVQERRLPEATDAWASESSEFSTLAELREDIASRLARARLAEVRVAVRRETLVALAGLVDDDQVPEVMVEDRLHDEVHRFEERLGAQKVTVSQFLSTTGLSADQLVAQMREGARQDVKVDLALRAVAEAEGIQATDEELDQAVAAMAGSSGTPDAGVAAVRARLEQTGGILAVRWQLRKDKALAWLLDHAQVVDEDGTPVDRAVLEVTEDAGGPDDAAGAGAPVEGAQDGGAGESDGSGRGGTAQQAQEDGQQAQEDGAGTQAGAGVTEEVG